jgi:hypothetical protein
MLALLLLTSFSLMAGVVIRASSGQPEFTINICQPLQNVRRRVDHLVVTHRSGPSPVRIIRPGDGVYNIVFVFEDHCKPGRELDLAVSTDYNFGEVGQLNEFTLIVRFLVATASATVASTLTLMAPAMIAFRPLKLK